MYRLHRASLIWHAVVWIALYIVTDSVGRAVSEAAGLEHSATAAALLVLAAVAVFYLHRHHRLQFYGVTPPAGSRWKPALYFVPLALMAVVQYGKGLDLSLETVDVLLIVLLMTAVGFLEELIFRGFLYRAIRERSGVVRAVLISGITFGIGHIVNLLNGYTGTQQVLQIVLGIGIGIALALLFEMTGSILPGVVFHVLLNISGNLSVDDETRELYAASVIIVIAVAYAVWLWVRLRRGFGVQSSRLDGGVLEPEPADERHVVAVA